MSKHNASKSESRIRRRARVRSRIFGTGSRPRISVFRSNAYISAQLIDDETGKTIVAVVPKDITTKATKTESAQKVGKLLAERAISKGITEVVFDRGGFLYHGRIKALAEAAREGGLKF